MVCGAQAPSPAESLVYANYRTDLTFKIKPYVSSVPPCFSFFPQASLRLISLGLVGRGGLSWGFLGLATFLSKSCATEGFRLPPMVLGTLGIFLPEVSLRCWVRMGICRILLSPCGFGLFSDISLPDCRPCGETILGPLRSAIRHLSHQSEMARNGAGWRQNRELTPSPAGQNGLLPCFLPDAARVFMYQRLAFGASERFGELRHISNGVIHPVLGKRVRIREDRGAHNLRSQLGAPIISK